MALDESLRTQPRTGLGRHWLIAIIGAAGIGVLTPWIVSLIGGYTGYFTWAELWIGLVGLVTTVLLLIVRRRSRLLPYAVGLIILPVASFMGGSDSLVWPHCDGLIWPHRRHAGVVVTV